MKEVASTEQWAVVPQSNHSAGTYATLGGNESCQSSADLTAARIPEIAYI